MREKDLHRELDCIKAKLDKILENQAVRGVFLQAVITIRPKPRGGKQTMELTRIDTDFNASIAIQAVSSKGQPVTVDGVPTWESSDPLLSLVPAADGMSCQVNTPDTVDGEHQIDVTVTADADRGDGVRSVSLVFPFVLTTPEATAITGAVTLTPKA